jgi:hypothetical protein
MTTQPQAESVKKIIDTFGGPTRVSEILNVHRTNVSKWKYVIQGDHALKLYHYSKQKRMGLKLEDFRPDIFDAKYRPKF